MKGFRFFIRENTEKRKGLSLAMRCFLVLILMVSSGVFISRMATYMQLIEQKKQLEEQKQDYESTIEEMKHHLSGAIDYEDIVRIAREKFNLAFPDEIVFENGDGGGS